MNKRIYDNQFVALIEQNRGLVSKICLFYANTEADREDLFQEIILQAWKSYSGFRKESKFSTWLYKIALNTALFVRRKRALDIQPLPEDIDDSSFQYAEFESHKLIQYAIKSLNEIERSVVLLYLDGYSYEEMEKIIGISSGALRVRMARIKDKLRNIIK